MTILFVVALAGCATSGTGTIAPLPAAPEVALGARVAPPAATGHVPFLFTENDPATYPALRAAATRDTRLGFDLVRSDATLATLVGLPRSYQLADSIAAVAADARRPNGAPLVFYDIEHWAQTPSAEQKDPIGAIAAAAARAHGARKAFGLASDGLFLGIDPGRCTFDTNAGILNGVDWSHVDVLNLQAQALARDGRCPGVATYASFVARAAAIARNANPRITIVAQLSFRDSTPATMRDAISSVARTVDAVYIAYPKALCSNCTIVNLSEVLTAIR